MKTKLIILLLSIASQSGFAQTVDGPINDRPVNVQQNDWQQNNMQADNSMNTTLPQGPGCYKYRKNNKVVLECSGSGTSNDNFTVNQEGTYMGYYPTKSPEEVAAQLRNNGKKIWLRPTYNTPYTIVSDPPCYMYKRHELVVMECPGIQFPPEHDNK